MFLKLKFTIVYFLFECTKMKCIPGSLRFLFKFLIKTDPHGPIKDIPCSIVIFHKFNQNGNCIRGLLFRCETQFSYADYNLVSKMKFNFVFDVVYKDSFQMLQHKMKFYFKLKTRNSLKINIYFLYLLINSRNGHGLMVKSTRNHQ